MKELLAFRKQRKKPGFFMQDSHKKKRLDNKWRRPRGSDSKMRVSRRGYRRSVEIGWRSPREIRGVHPSGLRPRLVSSVSELKGIDQKTEAALLSASVGTRKRILIVSEAIKRGITILNVKDPKHYLEEIAKKIELKAQQKKEQEKEKKEKKEKKPGAKEPVKKEEPKDELAAKLEEEEKKKKEKEEKDKILITKT